MYSHSSHLGSWLPFEAFVLQGDTGVAPKNTGPHTWILGFFGCQELEFSQETWLGWRKGVEGFALTQRLLGLSMEDPTSPLDTPLRCWGVSKPGCWARTTSNRSLWAEWIPAFCFLVDGSRVGREGMWALVCDLKGM